ncbi:MAG: dihydropteroate synthase [Burkholderiaceae bacterium]|nr:dihydropteroate synthase [Burkholderiaceae bacterium]
MPEHIVFLTGKLAERSLRGVLEELAPQEFTYDVVRLPINVAGLITADFIGRHFAPSEGTHRVIVPGRCRGDLDALGRAVGASFERGPDELHDLPEHFGRQRKGVDLSAHDVQIFAEIVEAPSLSVEQIVARAHAYRDDGADVIDLGCLPDTPFPHLADSVRALRQAGFRVSVDSLERDDLLTGGRAGADYLLSLKAETIDIADEVESTPVLIPSEPGDLDSLRRAIDSMRRRDRPFLADPILEPIQFGFARSLLRYQALRDAEPEAQILMGTGNVTELTDADTSGTTAVLLGVAVELRLNAILTTQVSPHCRRAVREADWARRMMFAARQSQSLPRDLTDALLTVHERRPFPYSSEEIVQLAAEVRDPNFRIQVCERGVHIFNRNGLSVATDPYELFARLDVEEDGAHAFYLGVELARAQIAWQLGKRYAQDEELGWGCAYERPPEDRMVQRAPGPTLTARRKRTARR